MNILKEELNKALDNKLYYEDGDCIYYEAETQETLADFLDSAKKWNERSDCKEFKLGNFNCLSWAHVQVAKGERREELTVVDLGDLRLVFNLDLKQGL